MNERGIGGLVVIDGDRIIGMFTERDVLRRVVAEMRDPARTPVSDVMTAPVVTVRPEATIAECAGIVTTRRIRHLPVMEGDELRGLITSGDILAFQVREQQDTINYLHNYVHDVR
jgi:CBS domain-containing protein